MHDENSQCVMRRKWIPLAALLLLLAYRQICAQESGNLVFNPSFEEHTQCPERLDALGIMRGVDAWWQPTRGSSDYFHPCGGKDCQVPRNKLGVQAAHGGEAYCGIYCSKEAYREYLQTELREPLQRGRRYKVSFWVSLADRAPHAVATLGAFFSRERVDDTTWNILQQREEVWYPDDHTAWVARPCEPQVVNPTDRVLDDAQGWQEVAGEFVAAGGERFLTLGNFFPFNQSHVVESSNGNPVLQGAYYYIDDVSVVCLDCAPQEQAVRPAPSIRKGQVIRLKNILFDTDKSELLPQSYKDLRDLVQLLNEQPTLRLEVRGHTDDQGTVEHNRALSESRAKAVVDYLIEHGIAPDRLEWHGYGKSLPIDSNDTPEGRHNNRRVEYQVLSL